MYRSPFTFLSLADVQTEGRGVPTRSKITAKCKPSRKVIFLQSSQCYHAIGKDYATILDGCIAQNDFSEIHSKAIFLAGHFAIDFLC
jgi:hypothetical protein